MSDTDADTTEHERVTDHIYVMKDDHVLIASLVAEGWHVSGPMPGHHGERGIIMERGIGQ